MSLSQRVETFVSELCLSLQMVYTDIGGFSDKSKVFENISSWNRQMALMSQQGEEQKLFHQLARQALGDVGIEWAINGITAIFQKRLPPCRAHILLDAVYIMRHMIANTAAIKRVMKHRYFLKFTMETFLAIEKDCDAKGVDQYPMILATKQMLLRNLAQCLVCIKANTEVALFICNGLRVPHGTKSYHKVLSEKQRDSRMTDAIWIPLKTALRDHHKCDIIGDGTMPLSDICEPISVFCSSPQCLKKADSESQFPRCGKCQVARYCGKGCQKFHWTHGHRELCMTDIIIDIPGEIPRR